MSFKMAGILAFKTVAPKCKPVLLEPLDELEITIPDEYMGDVLGDLSGRRGQILGTDSTDSGQTRIRAIVPHAELHLYGSALQSMTQGRAVYTRRFRGYDEMPTDVAQRVIAEAAKTKEQEVVAAH
jgi:elongation factor G